MAKKDEAKDLAAEIRAFITENPTASDAQVAAAVEGARTDDVSDVRAEMGPRHTWKPVKASTKPEEAK